MLNVTIQALRRELDETMTAWAAMFPAGEDGNPTVPENWGSDEQAKYAEFNSKAKNLRERITAYEDYLEAAGESDRTAAALEAADTASAEARAARLGVSVDEAGESIRLENEAFATFLVRGLEAVNANERLSPHFNAIGTGDGAAPHGGYAVPVGVAARLVEAMKTYSAMLRYATILTAGDVREFYVPTVDDTGQEGEIVGEASGSGDNANAASKQDANLGRRHIQIVRCSSKTIEVTRQWLSATAIPAAEQRLYSLLAKRCARTWNRRYTTDANIGVMTQATNFRTKANNAWDPGDFTKAYYALDEAYRDMAVWMLNDASIQDLADMQIGAADKRPLIMPSYKEGLGTIPMILGKPVVSNNHMAGVAASAYAGWFGDLSGYEIYGVPSMMLTHRFAEESKYAERGVVGFMLEDWGGGNYIDQSTGRVMRIKA